MEIKRLRFNQMNAYTYIAHTELGNFVIEVMDTGECKVHRDKIAKPVEVNPSIETVENIATAPNYKAAEKEAQKAFAKILETMVRT